MLTAVCLCCLLDYFERLRVIVHHINYINNPFIACFNYACSSGFRRLIRVFVLLTFSLCNGFCTFNSLEMFFFWSLVGSAWIHISCWLIRRTCALVVMTTHPHHFTRLQTVYLLHASGVRELSFEINAMPSVWKVCSALHG